MSNTYVVTSASYVASSAPDPVVTVIGTVNGVPVQVQIYLSAVTDAQSSGGLTAVKNLVAPLMLAALPPVPAVLTQLPTGTFVQ